MFSRVQRSEIVPDIHEWSRRTAYQDSQYDEPSTMFLRAKVPYGDQTDHVVKEDVPTHDPVEGHGDCVKYVVPLGDSEDPCFKHVSV